MTSLALAPPEQIPTSTTLTTNDGQPPRKRRRRTAGGGASDDCFACRKRGSVCDRKRPYCTQCIDIGKECSGYKTALTWDVGVASRGKLRGLSCPVANKNVDGSDASPAEIGKRRRKSSTSKPKKEEVVVDNEARDLHSIPAAEPAAPPQDTFPGSAESFVAPSMPLMGASNGWQVPGFQSRVQSRQMEGRQQRPMIQLPELNLHTSFAPSSSSLQIPLSARSFSSYADSDFRSPLEYPYTPASMRSNEQPVQPLSATFQETFAATALTDGRFDRDTFGPYTAVPVNVPGTDGGSIQRPKSLAGELATSNAIDNGMFNRAEMYLGPSNGNHMALSPYDSSDSQSVVEDYGFDRNNLALFDTRFSSPFFNMSPRLQSLMEYYSCNICPYLVAFDGPENPYRKHILQLAVENEGLQHAIAALSTNNFRMRKKQPRQIGFVEEIASAFDSNSSSEWNEPSAEESCFKKISIDQLNVQLASGQAAKDDSVLGMLLILCLFHVCDSGFSQFQNQLAGVQLLLSYRAPDAQSAFTRWVKMFFMWFDVMNSTVNDREVQIEGDSLAMLDYSANLGALEQYSGCDGRLFKLITRLGRLNILAQGKPVRGQTDSYRKLAPVQQSYPALPTHSSRTMRPTMNFGGAKSFNPEDYNNIDGNGWGTTIFPLESDAPFEESSDDRIAFWTEFRDIRSRLMAWRMELPSVTPNAPSDPARLEEGQRDMLHINEAFRFAALLYTERLGNPLLPSSHDQFQQLVAQVLFHITALPVTSCVNKFLMWPLFIAGTECVDEGHRDFVRRRCRDLTEESGFYNNISSLWVLEKVWSEVGSNVRGSEAAEMQARRKDSEASSSGRYGQAFRWRKAMDKKDGEYIVL